MATSVTPAGRRGGQHDHRATVEAADLDDLIAGAKVPRPGPTSGGPGRGSSSPERRSSSANTASKVRDDGEEAWSVLERSRRLATRNLRLGVRLGKRSSIRSAAHCHRSTRATRETCRPCPASPALRCARRGGARRPPWSSAATPARARRTRAPAGATARARPTRLARALLAVPVDSPDYRAAVARYRDAEDRLNDGPGHLRDAEAHAG